MTEVLDDLVERGILSPQRARVHRAWLVNQPPQGTESYAEYQARWARIREQANEAGK